jgi:hypothetical protein
MLQSFLMRVVRVEPGCPDRSVYIHTQKHVEARVRSDRCLTGVAGRIGPPRPGGGHPGDDPARRGAPITLARSLRDIGRLSLVEAVLVRWAGRITLRTLQRARLALRNR